MRKGKKFTMGFLPTLLTLVAMLVAACGGGGGTSNVTPTAGLPAKAPAAQQIFRYADGQTTDIATFDPGQATDQPSIEAIGLVFTGMVQLDDKLQVQPQMAASYSSNGLVWTFNLKPNLKFSDGTPLTANDVAYSLDRALSPAISSLNGVTLTYLGLIKDADKRVAGKISTLIGDSVNVLDPNTITLTVSKSTPYFLEALTYPTAYVVEKKVIDQWGAKWTDHLADNGGQGGAGPFKVASYSHSTGINFVPNTNYYGKEPQLQQVQFIFYKDVPTAYQAYQANQADLSTIPPPQTEQARLLTKEYHLYSQLTIDYLTMNYLTKPFDNIHIRQAFEMAINRDVLSKSLYKSVRLPTCHIVPSGMPGYFPGLKCPGGAPTSGDAAMAKTLFQQGLQEEGLTLATLPPIKFTYESNAPTLDNEITAVRQMWQTALGVTVQPQLVDFNVLLTDVTNSTCTQADPSKCVGKGLQMWALAWGADYPDPQDWLTLQFDKGAPNNNMNYGQNISANASTQQQMQQLMEQADTTLDTNTRMPMYNQAEQQLVNDVAWLPIDQRSGQSVLKSYVIGKVFNAQGAMQVPPDDWSNIYIAVH
jgi:oligopeptide transport system substrate-binding protein